ncbi:hypothetical protein D3C71_36620 [compost metagenome]
MKFIKWIFRLIPAIILLQTLYFKFSAASESVYIFSKLGMEPYGRIGIGVVELIAATLILVPKTTGYGAVLGFGLMIGAIQFHLTKLGVEVHNDGGKVFYLAIITALFCGILIITNKKQLLNVFAKK